MIYLDNSATTRQYDEVTEVMCGAMRDEFGNPSSLHRLGMNAELLVKDARRKAASALGAEPEEVYFTSGGTESDNTAIIGAAMARRRRGKRIITTQVEHPAVLESCRRLEERGFEVVYVGVDKGCGADVGALKEALNGDTILVSVMGVNNETGTIQPLEEISAAVRGFNEANGCDVLLHTDMVQGFGKIAIKRGLFDMITVSAHKIHGPKGIGALYVRKGLNVEPYIVGGGQERHFRSGTENVPAIAGFGRACELACGALEARNAKAAAVCERLRNGILESIPDVRINGENTVPFVLNVSFLGVRGEVLLHSLEQDGIYVSTGSACSSNKKSKSGSHVLRAMGLSDREVEGAIRFSFSEFNTLEDIDFTLEKLKSYVTKFRKLGSFR